jgi:hypothetical protein
MAESRRQRSLRCQIHYLPDRHVPQKMSQVYRWLVPEAEAGEAPERSDLTTAQYEKNRSHLRSSFL